MVPGPLNGSKPTVSGLFIQKPGQLSQTTGSCCCFVALRNNKVKGEKNSFTFRGFAALTHGAAVTFDPHQSSKHRFSLFF